MAVKLKSKRHSAGAAHRAHGFAKRTFDDTAVGTIRVRDKQRRGIDRIYKASENQVAVAAGPKPGEFEAGMAEMLVETADPSDVKRLCETYGLRRQDLGRMTGFSLRALADWSAGKLPSEPAKRRLHEIRRLLDSLGEVVKPGAIAPWLKQRNPAFENMTPMQVIEVGEIDRLWQMVHHMGSDSPD